ncbi:MAG TPA: amino acid racemase [Xanthomonadales bacterium]
MTLPSPLIGILGGMGPQAGLDLAEKIINLTRAESDQDHVPFILFSLPKMVSDRTAFLLGRQQTNPAFAIAEQFEKMSTLGCTIAVMACNTAHAGPIFDVALDLLDQKGIKLRILHMVRETVAHIQMTRPRIKRVGILGTEGTYQTGLYDRALENAGLEAILPAAEIRKSIHDAIYSTDFGIKVSTSVVSERATKYVHEAVRHLVELGAEAVILGCTELPLALKDNQVDGVQIVDPARIIAEKLIFETYPEKLALPG